MKPLRLVVLALLCVASSASFVAAETAYYPDLYEPHAEWFPEPYEDVTIPSDGVLVLRVRWSHDLGLGPEDGLPYVSVAVLDAGTALAGTLDYEPALQAVVWRPDAALTPGASLSVDWLFENRRMNVDSGMNYGGSDPAGTFTLTVSYAPMGALPAWIAVLHEVTPSLGVDRRCCPYGEALCDADGSCTQCFEEPYSRVYVALEAELTLDPVILPCVYYDVIREPGGPWGSERLTEETSRISLAHTERGGVGEYCVHIDTTEIVHGTTSRSSFCDTVTELPAFTPSPYDLAMCELYEQVQEEPVDEPGVDEGTGRDASTSSDSGASDSGASTGGGEQVSTSEGCGCRVAGGDDSDDTANPLLAVFGGLFGLLLVRRRR